MCDHKVKENRPNPQGWANDFQLTIVIVDPCPLKTDRRKTNHWTKIFWYCLQLIKKTIIWDWDWIGNNTKSIYSVPWQNMQWSRVFFMRMEMVSLTKRLVFVFLDWIGSSSATFCSSLKSNLHCQHALKQKIVPCTCNVSKQPTSESAESQPQLLTRHSGWKCTFIKTLNVPHICLQL